MNAFTIAFTIAFGRRGGVRDTAQARPASTMPLEDPRASSSGYMHLNGIYGMHPGGCVCIGCRLDVRPTPLTRVLAPFAAAAVALHLTFSRAGVL